MEDCKELKTCLCCDNTRLILVLDLKDQPLANSYHNGENLPVFPLKLNLCGNCWHLQLSHMVNPDLMFKNYLYVSGTSQTGRDYFKWFSEFTLKLLPNAKTVLDIASNDGSQLDCYKNIGLDTVGIDPAINLSDIARSKGHEIIVDYFNENSLITLKNRSFDIIVAQNVFAHNTYPLKFLKLCKEVLSDDGYLFIQTSQSDMITNNEFDTIYHEHISFFNIISMSEIIKKSGLTLNRFIKTEIHGISSIYVISKRKEVDDSVINEIENFKNNNLNNYNTYVNYSNNSYKIVGDLIKIIDEYRNNGYYVVGYGAAAKGNTLLNFGNISLDYILDDNKMKCGLLTPGMNIQIKAPNYILELSDKPILFIPLSWNFYNEIKSNIKKIRNRKTDMFVKYFPKLTIEN